MVYLSSVPAKNLKGKVCLLRLDFNTEDNWRMEASLPTIRFLLKNCRAVVILNHKGRSVGFDRSLSLLPKAQILSRFLKKKVVFLPDFHFKEIKDLIVASPKGS